MKLFNKQTRLETLQKQLEDLDMQIEELKQELKELRGETTPLNPILLRFLKLNFNFNYAAEKEALDRLIRQKETFLRELETEKARLEPELHEALFQEELQQKGVKFVGEDVESFEGTTVKIKCAQCKHSFSLDLKGHGCLNNVLLAQTPEEFKFVRNRGLNQVWPLSCPRCGRHLELIVTREF